MKRIACILIIVFVILLITSSNSMNNEQKTVKEIFAMDTYMTLKAYGDNAYEAIELSAKEIEQLDATLAAASDTSDIAMLNRKGEAVISADAVRIIEAAIQINKDTDGAFNPFMYPIMKCWGFDKGEYRIPSQKQLDECLLHIDATMVDIDEKKCEVKFADRKMQLDLGGIAKGYTSDKIKQIFKKNGVTSGIVSLGGNVRTIGSRPDGSPWSVAIRNPDKSGEYAGILSVNDAAVVTSGGYERYFEQCGKIYHHIIDPQTARPAQNGLNSVTIVNDNGMVADALSTALYIMGYDESVKFWKQYKEPFEMILIKDDGSQYITEGLESLYKSEADYTIIKR